MFRVFLNNLNVTIFVISMVVVSMRYKKKKNNSQYFHQSDIHVFHFIMDFIKVIFLTALDIFAQISDLKGGWVIYRNRRTTQICYQKKSCIKNVST